MGVATCFRACTLLRQAKHNKGACMLRQCVATPIIMSACDVTSASSVHSPQPRSPCHADQETTPTWFLRGFCCLFHQDQMTDHSLIMQYAILYWCLVSTNIFMLVRFSLITTLSLSPSPCSLSSWFYLH